MKTIVVTGGAGFVGSHLVERLLEEGNKVIVIDDFQTSNPENISGFSDNQNFKLIEQNIVDKIQIAEPVDQIYNLACPASPPNYQKDPIGTMKTSTVGVMNILDLAKEKNARVLQASTSEVYGDPTVSPQSEDYRGNVNTVGPRACYDEGKRCSETLFFDYHRVHGLEVKVVRIFNTYGPRMDKNDGRVVSNFIVQALTGKPMTLYGDGKQTRSFCFVDDLVTALILMMNSDKAFTGPVNLGNPYEITVKELAERVIKMTGSESEMVYRDLPTDDPLQRRPNIEKANMNLSWEPQVNLDDGLARTIEYFKTKI